MLGGCGSVGDMKKHGPPPWAIIKLGSRAVSMPPTRRLFSAKKKPWALSGHSGARIVSAKEEVTFLKKSNQKTFAPGGLGGSAA
jgi:hypothetical protein